MTHSPSPSKPTTTVIPQDRPGTLILWQFTTDVRHIGGSANAPADALWTPNSIIPLDSSDTEFKAMAQLQATDPALQEIVNHPNSSKLKLKGVSLTSTGLELSYAAHQLAPTGPSFLLLSCIVRCSTCSLHSMSHPGIRAITTASFQWLHLLQQRRWLKHSCLDFGTISWWHLAPNASEPVPIRRKSIQSALSHTNTVYRPAHGVDDVGQAITPPIFVVGIMS